MSGFFEMRGNGADALTGDRVGPGERVFDTGIMNRRKPYMGNTKTRILKESTIVWLAEQAGLVVVKRDAGDSGDAEVVDESNVGVGGGEVEAGEVEAGGRKPVKRRSSGATKGK